MTATTLADPIFQSIINKGEVNMNDQIICETTEEHSHPSPTSTTLITPTPTPRGEVPHNPTQPIQGVSGAVYAPMDTTPQTPEQQANARVKMFMEMLTTALNGLVKELQTPTQPQTDLEEAVSTALSQADWFTERLHNTVQDSIDDKDFDYEIGNCVESYMENSFSLDDHCDMSDLVNDRVDDVIEDLVAEKVQDLLEERLANLIEEKLENANITINF